MEETANAQNQFSILAASARDDTSIRVLKQGETFAVFDKYGDLYDLGNRELGLYHEGTRYLSTFDMFFSRQRPLLLSSTIHKGHPILSVNLTNPDISVDGTILLRNGTLHLARTKFLYEGASYERLQISNYGLERVRTSLTIDLGSDFGSEASLNESLIAGAAIYPGGGISIPARRELTQHRQFTRARGGP